MKSRQDFDASKVPSHRSYVITFVVPVVVLLCILSFYYVHHYCIIVAIQFEILQGAQDRSR
jgi:nitrate reductase NapE component